MGENRTRSQTRRIPARRVSVLQRACCRLRLHQVYVASSSFRLLLLTWTRRFLAVLDGTCGARGDQKHCSTRVHISGEEVQRFGQKAGRRHTGYHHFRHLGPCCPPAVWGQSLKGLLRDHEHRFEVLCVS